MEIEELKEERDELQQTITGLLTEFTEKTSAVCAVSVDFREQRTIADGYINAIAKGGFYQVEVKLQI